jgi:hypothetical protein
MNWRTHRGAGKFALFMGSVSVICSIRSIVLILILYFGWTGVLVVAVPFLSYRKTRQIGANPFQAIFLAATSCLLVSWFILLVDAEVQQRQIQALGNLHAIPSPFKHTSA